MFARMLPLLFIPTLAMGQSPSPWTPLFNGRDLAGWHYMDTFDPRKLAAMSDAERTAKLAQWRKESEAHWRVQDGSIINDGQGAYLTTDRSFGDFELLIEYKTKPKADSGIYLRGCPQVQIWDHTDESQWKHGSQLGSGGLWNNSPGTPGKDPLVLADRPFGHWNQLRIIMVGERVTVFLNDRLVVDHARMENYFESDRRKPLPRTGPIQLQTHGGEIQWRNLFIREIGPTEANAILARNNASTCCVEVLPVCTRHHGRRCRSWCPMLICTPSQQTDGFASIFNGHDFIGWTGPTHQYDIIDGAIVCKPKQGGTIFTTEEYSDFIVRFEYNLPPGGNNGLAIRYPGSGDTAYVGMCELQILDDDAPQYQKLDPRQFNLSAYGMAASQRGYLRPTGEWNFAEVTVRGSTIVAELNGTRVLDADLAKVTELMSDTPHPGKDRKRGHFGFAGHSDPVAFRNIRIKRLGD